MTPKITLYVSIAVLIVVGGVFAVGRFRTGKAVAEGRAAQAATAMADTSQGHAEVKDDTVAKLVATHAQDQKTVAAAKAEARRLQAVIDNQPAPTTVPITPEHAALIELDAAKDVVIARQDDQIKGLEAINGALVEDRDQWKQTAELRLKQAEVQRAATDAWKKAGASMKQEGRIEGGAAVAILWGVAKLVAH